MAQDFDFTVRATDDAGAYADRNFSITVNNTVVPRFVGIGDGGNEIFYSNDGAEWFKLDGFSGMTDVAYGGGYWLATTSGTTVYRSTDGTVWSPDTMTLSNGGTQYPRRIRYNTEKGEWYGLNNSGTDYEFRKSTDNGLTWEYISNAVPTGTVTDPEETGFNFNGDDFVVKTRNKISYSSNAGATWNSVNPTNLGTVLGEVIFVNNAWFVLSSTGVFRSFNMSSWTQVLPLSGANISTSLVYANGQLVVHWSNNVATHRIYISEDAGDSWSVNIPTNVPASNDTNNTPNKMAFYNGIYVWYSDTADDGGEKIRWAIEPETEWFDSTAGNTGGNEPGTAKSIASRV